jgi:hypothetical protein
MALIMALPTGTAVYNLDDSRKNSIVITIGKDQMTLAPGEHAMITSHLVDGFEMVNPAESFSYRNVSGSLESHSGVTQSNPYGINNAPPVLQVNRRP